MNLEIMFLEERIVLEAAAADVLVNEAVDVVADNIAEPQADQNTDAADNADAPHADQNVDGASDNTSETQPEQAVNEMVEALATPVDVRKELVFVDTSVDNYEALLQDIDESVEVILLSGDGDAMSEMVSILEGRSDLDAIHIISHGGEGFFSLGTETISAQNLDDHQGDLSIIGESLNEDGDLLLYGCEIATGTGQEFVNAVAELTGADVAASDDNTGAADAGGDWDLEVSTGEIETDSPLSDKAIDDFDGVLGKNFTIDFSNDSAMGRDSSYNATYTTNGFTFIFDSTRQAESISADRERFETSANEKRVIITVSDGSSFGLSSLDITNHKHYEMPFVIKGLTTSGNWISMTTESIGSGETKTVNLSNFNSVKKIYIQDTNYSDYNYFSLALDNLVFKDVKHPNTAPILDNTKSPTLPTISEDLGAPTNGNQHIGTSAYAYSILDSTETAGSLDNYYDVDDNVKRGIAITGISDKGTLYYTVNSTGDCIWKALNSGDVSANSALILLNYTNTRIYFKPNSDFNGTINDAITFKAYDRSAGYYNGSFKNTNTGTAFSSASDTVAIEITPVDDAPTISTAPTDVSVLEDTVSDVDLSGVSVQEVDGEDVVLKIAAGGGTLTTAANDSSVSGVTISGSGTGTLSLAGSVADINAYLDKITNIKYKNNTPDTQGDNSDTLNLTVNDGTSGDVALKTVNVDITSVNDAPETSGAYDFTAINEDTASTGVQVSTIIGGLTTSDVDLDTLGIAVTGTSGNGTWQFSTDSTDGANGNWISFADTQTPSPSNSLLLTGAAWVRYVPDGNNAETSSITMRGWDQSSGTASTGTTANYANTSTNGNDTAYSSGTATGSITVTAVNDLPVIDLNSSTAGTDSTATFAAGSSGVPIAADAIISDADTGDFLESMTVTLTSRLDGDSIESLGLDVAAATAATNAGLTVGYTADTGILSITGSASASVYQAVLRGVQYSNSDAGSDITTGNRSITVMVNDGDGDSTARTSIVSVVAAPVIDLNGTADNQNHTVSFNEGDMNVSLAASTATIIEPDGENLNRMTVQLTNAQDGVSESITMSGRNSGDTVNGITITYNSATQITLSGSATAANYQALLRELIYNNSSENPDTTTRTVEVAGRDTGGNTGATVTTSISITAVNDNPSATGLASDVTVIEDVASNVDLSAITLKDIDAGTGDITLILTASAGTLAASTGGSVTVSGSGTGAITLSGTLANVDAFLNTASNVKYTSALNANGNDAATLTVTINDGGNTGTGGGSDVTLGTVNIDITATHDSPAATNVDQVQTYTDGDSSVALDDIIVSDPDTDEQVTATLTLADITQGSISTIHSGNERYDALTGIWTITGTVEQVNTALAAAAFEPINGLTSAVSITVNIQDGGEHGEEAQTGTITLNYQAPPPPLEPEPEPEPETDTDTAETPATTPDPIPEQVRNNSSGDKTPSTTEPSDPADSADSNGDFGNEFIESETERGREISIDSASSGRGTEGNGPAGADADLNQVITALGRGSVSGDMGDGPGAADVDLNQVLQVLDSAGASIDSGFGGQGDPLGIDANSLLDGAGTSTPAGDNGPATADTSIQAQSRTSITDKAATSVAAGPEQPAGSDQSTAIATSVLETAQGTEGQRLHQPSLSELNNALSGLSFSSSTPDFTITSLEHAVDTLAQLAGESRQSANPAAGDTLNKMTDQLTEICEKCAENGQNVDELLQKLDQAKAMLSN
ncbi:DUF4347 domain-containing protein [Desulfovibrio sp. JC022]|uniref:DUF4347 domain-containing protein n=1 Tax=Desulfovibrio sp. JC022 TaxID=2593642 RepID=UPI0013D81A77|nr:DUF4347 domain-containing protein [Desulfovibrio sp. JC022]NDV24536.1 DUF4347 domain-containing protein [Desulfovibrio sp. JC022]